MRNIDPFRRVRVLVPPKRILENRIRVCSVPATVGFACGMEGYIAPRDSFRFSCNAQNELQQFNPGLFHQLTIDQSYAYIVWRQFEKLPNTISKLPTDSIYV